MSFSSFLFSGQCIRCCVKVFCTENSEPPCSGNHTAHSCCAVLYILSRHFYCPPIKSLYRVPDLAALQVYFCTFLLSPAVSSLRNLTRESEVSIGTDLQFVLYPLTLLSPWLLCLMLFLIIFSFWVRNQKSVPENDVLEKWGLWYYLACFILSLTRHCVKLTP